MRLETRLAHRSDLDEASRVLGEAFADYAWTRWTVDDCDHVDRIAALQRLSLEHYGLVFGQVWIAFVDDVLSSVAVWMDSSVTIPDDVHEELRDATARLEGSRHEASLAAGSEVRGWRPVERHAYLATVGTLPAVQRQGVGRVILGAGLAVADRAEIPAFLETSAASNVAFYSTLGFLVVGHHRIKGAGPDVWAMQRPPDSFASVRSPDLR